MVCSETLKNATKKPHVETEAALIPRLKSIKSNSDYIRLLVMLYHFISPLEKLVENHLLKIHLSDIETRRRSPLIIKSLQLLGAPEMTEATCRMPQITNVTQAFGALYVMEGSTMGGHVIAGMLKSNTCIELPEGSLAFFTAYGNNTVGMWSSFKQCLDGSITTEADISEVVRAANDTFFSMKEWILNNN
jgi:heme oxygenase